MLSFEKLRNANVLRCEEVFHPVDRWTPADWANALAGEVGKTCDLIKKMRKGGQVTQKQREKIAKQLAQAIIYADLLGARLDIDLGTAVVLEFNAESHKRKANYYLT